MNFNIKEETLFLYFQIKLLQNLSFLELHEFFLENVILEKYHKFCKCLIIFKFLFILYIILKHFKNTIQLSNLE